MTVDIADGTILGTKEGVVVGAMDGITVGAALGDADGFLEVGLFVG